MTTLASRSRWTDRARVALVLHRPGRREVHREPPKRSPPVAKLPGWVVQHIASHVVAGLGVSRTPRSATWASSFRRVSRLGRKLASCPSPERSPCVRACGWACGPPTADLHRSKHLSSLRRRDYPCASRSSWRTLAVWGTARERIAEPRLILGGVRAA
jgi:hypothetical protein